MGTAPERNNRGQECKKNWCPKHRLLPFISECVAWSLHQPRFATANGELLGIRGVPWTASGRYARRGSTRIDLLELAPDLAGLVRLAQMAPGPTKGTRATVAPRGFRLHANVSALETKRHFDEIVQKHRWHIDPPPEASSGIGGQSRKEMLRQA